MSPRHAAWGLSRGRFDAAARRAVAQGLVAYVIKPFTPVGRAYPEVHHRWR